MIKFEVVWRTTAPDDDFSIFSLNIHIVLTNFILGMWTHTFQAEFNLGENENLFSSADVPHKNLKFGYFTLLFCRRPKTKCRACKAIVFTH